MLDTRIQLEIGANLKEEDFYSEAHKNIFHAMLDIIKSNQPIDFVTLTDTLEKMGTLNDAGGISYIAELTNIMPSSANYQRYLSIVSRDSMLRKLMSGAVDIIGECQTSQNEFSSLAFAEKTIYDISNTKDTREAIRIDKVLPDVMFKFDEISKGESKFRGIPTQFKELDGIIKGVHNSDLMILAARPAVGKTSFAMNIAENMFLGREPLNRIRLVDYPRMHREARQHLSQLGLDIDTHTQMANLRVGQQPLVEIAKALMLNAKILIMDEPTSSLSEAETERLF